VCCSVLQCVAVCCSVLQCVAVCCSMLQCVAVCCSVLQCVAVRITMRSVPITRASSFRCIYYTYIDMCSNKMRQSRSSIILVQPIPLGVTFSKALSRSYMILVRQSRSHIILLVLCEILTVET